MIQVRNGVFETNSSSTHSICIPKKTNKTDTFVEFGIDEYGWEHRSVYDTPSYLYTSILCAYEYDEVMEKLEALKSILNNRSIGYSFEKPMWYEWDSGYKSLNNGYVDHAYETRDFVEAVLNDDDMLLRYLFDGIVYTGNDNDDYYPYGRDIEDDPENFDYFYKGN